MAGVVGYVLYSQNSTAAGDGTIIDGIAFPGSHKLSGTTVQLAGGGTRIKYGVAKVYAVALYLDSRGASGALQPFAGAKPPTKAAKFYQAIIDGGFTKTLHMQFHRSVSAEAMVEALNEAMNKRLAPDAVAKFASAVYKALPSSSIAKGDQLFFTCKAKTLSIGAGVPGARAALSEKGVCAALFDVFYGKSPVSPAAKEGAAVGFAKRFYLKQK